MNPTEKRLMSPLERHRAGLNPQGHSDLSAYALPGEDPNSPEIAARAAAYRAAERNGQIHLYSRNA